MRHARLLLAALCAACAPALSQPVYKCTTPGGTITYQQVPCAGPDGSKRVDAARAPAPDPAARALLEREAMRGNPLARGFLDEARERDRRELMERLEREERLRRERAKRPRAAPEPPDWNPPWGWAGPPGLARPKPGPGS